MMYKTVPYYALLVRYKERVIWDSIADFLQTNRGLLTSKGYPLHSVGRARIRAAWPVRFTVIDRSVSPKLLLEVDWVDGNNFREFFTAPPLGPSGLEERLWRHINKRMQERL